MTEQQQRAAPLPDYAWHDARDRSLNEDLRELAQDGRALAEAEIAFQKARAAYAAGQVRVIAMLGVAAAVLVFFTIMALILGLTLALTPVLGPWGAMGAVTGGLLVLTAVAAWSAASRWRRMTRVIGGEED